MPSQHPACRALYGISACTKQVTIPSIVRNTATVTATRYVTYRTIRGTSLRNSRDTEVSNQNGEWAWTEAVGDLEESFPDLYFSAPPTRHLPPIGLNPPLRVWVEDSVEESQYSFEGISSSDEDESFEETTGRPSNSSMEALHDAKCGSSLCGLPASHISGSAQQGSTGDDESSLSSSDGDYSDEPDSRQEEMEMNQSDFAKTSGLTEETVSF